MITGCHHIGQMVDDHDEVVEFYCETLNGTLGETVTIEERVRVSFIDLPETRLEVIERTERGTYLDELLDELLARSQYHVAYTVMDIHDGMASLEANGYRLFDPEPVEGVGLYVRAFVHPADVPGMPIELIGIK